MELPSGVLEEDRTYEKYLLLGVKTTSDLSPQVGYPSCNSTYELPCGYNGLRRDSCINPFLHAAKDFVPLSIHSTIVDHQHSMPLLLLMSVICPPSGSFGFHVFPCQCSYTPRVMIDTRWSSASWTRNGAIQANIIKLIYKEV